MTFNMCTSLAINKDTTVKYCVHKMDDVVFVQLLLHDVFLLVKSQSFEYAI